MGLLDDAIREHLELKRLRGADPSDVARLEREALGPVRRGAAGPEDLAGDETLAPPPAEPFDAERAATHPLVDESATLIPGGEPSTVGQDTAEIDMESVIAAEPFEPPAERQEAREDYPPREEPSSAEHREPYVPADAPAASAASAAAEDQPYVPAEPEAGEAQRAPEDEDVEDVLEETPSFLQQTPEHDRLWFEQQPPRDFDFDK